MGQKVSLVVDEGRAKAKRRAGGAGPGPPSRGRLQIMALVDHREQARAVGYFSVLIFGCLVKLNGGPRINLMFFRIISPLKRERKCLEEVQFD